MSLDEMMMHAMRDAYAYAAKMRAGSLPQEPMRAVLDLLHANGYRRCAEGQRTTQWCDRAEKAEAEVERLRAAVAEFVDDYENGDMGDLKHYARAMRAARGES